MDSTTTAIDAIESSSVAVEVPKVDAEPVPIDIVLVVPTQHFVPISSELSKTRHIPSSGYQEIPFQIQKTDVIHELRSLIHDAPEGFWLGAFGLIPCESELTMEAVEGGAEAFYGPWKDCVPAVGSKDVVSWSLTSEGVSGDFSDIDGVYANAATTSRKGLRAVPTSFNNLAMSLHLLRIRDTLFTSLPALVNGSVYDPNGLYISAGGSVYLDVRGKDVPEASESTASESTTHAFTDFKLEDLNPFKAFDHMKTKPVSHASPCCKTFAISPWSPPPHARKLRGDLVYLTFTTVEGESYNITGSTSGFWVSKSSLTTFDPSPRLPTPKNLKSTPYHTLFELFSALSPTFSTLLSQYIESQQSLIMSPEVFASIPFTMGTPAIPWLTPSPAHTADPFRSQLAYLLTSSATAELLPTARDWIDEFGTYKDLPSNNVPERLLRERSLARVKADFNSAAIRGCLSISNGDVPPLNSNDPPSAHTFVNNNMLFTRAEDAVNAFDYLGGDYAAHVAAGKDLAAVELLEEMDIEGLSTLATIVVDYLGSRWVVQSLLPGLFKSKDTEEETKKKEVAIQDAPVYPEGDEEALAAKAKALAEGKPFPSYETDNRDDYPPSSLFRIVYGASSPEEPEEVVKNSAYFGKLAKQVAEKAYFAEHKVIDTKGVEHKLWTSSEVHGIATPDGKSYFIDCFRLHCVDVAFLESDTPATEALPAYPHTLVLLRSELLRSYRDSKLEKWISALISESQAGQAARAALEAPTTTQTTIEAKPDSVEGELKEAATDSTSTTSAETSLPPRGPPAVINAADFILNFNPDAFVVRNPDKGSDAPLLYDPEEESSKNVRLASEFLRETLIPYFIVEVVDSGLIITDGIYLTKLMHRKGINMRYLGLIVDLIEQKSADYKYKESRPKANEYALAALKATLKHEMVSRASKHILNNLLRDSSPYDHPHVVAHFFNCLIGSQLQATPIASVPTLPAGVSPTRSWTSLTPSSLRTQIQSQVALRFRHNLDDESIASILPVTLLREICIRVGIQLALRTYDFGSSDTASLSAIVPVKVEEKHESNGDSTLKKRKKKTAGSKVEIVAEEQRVTVRPEDVLNLYPIVKVSNFQSTLVEESYIAGQRNFEEGNNEFGTELISDALTMCEQIYGPLHPSASTKYHALGIHYHELAQNMKRKVFIHEKYTSSLQQLSEADRLDFIKNNPDFFQSDLEAVRTEGNLYISQAARMVRQSIIISERTRGIDHPDTIAQFSDLGLLEQNDENPIVGLKLLRHSLDLWTAAYGTHHPSTLTLLNNAASMVLSKFGPTEAMPLHNQCRKLAVHLYGEESHQVAHSEYVLATNYGSIQDGINGLKVSYEHAKESLRLFTATIGETAPDTVEASNFVKLLEEVFAREEADRQIMAERLKNKVPEITGRKLNGGARSEQQKVEEVVVPQKAHGQKADLSVDELVNFIQGNSTSKSSKSNGAVNKKRKASPQGKSSVV